MAVTHNSVNSLAIFGGDSISVNVTVAPGDRFAVLIGITWAQIGPTFDEAVSTVQFDGTDATFVELNQAASGGASEHYYAKGFSSGIRVAEVTWVGSGTTDINAVVGLEVMSDVDQTAPIGQSNSAAGNSNAPSTTVATTDTDGFVVESVYIQFNTNTTVTLGGGQTQRWNAVSGVAPDRLTGRGSTEPSGASGTIMSYALGAVRNWAICATEFRPHVEIEPPDPGDVNVLTSYHYLEVSPDKLDRADRLPEEMAKVWTGRWRH